MAKKKGISRRTFVAGAAAAGAAVAGSTLLAACKTTGGSGGGGGEKPVDAFKYYVNEPAYLDPYNLQESEGTQVSSQLFDSLVEYDYRTEKLLPAAAESWVVNDDGTVFTFTLRANAKFHNGDELKAEDVQHAPQRLFAHGHGYGGPGVKGLHAPDKAVGGVHRDAANGVVS